MNKTALIIEDNDDNMELISFILEKNGYATLRAVRGEQGVAMALEHLPDFIILDIQLPDIDGLEVAKRIRASKIDGTIPIVAMTSYAMVGDREALLGAGCDGYIEKPIDVSTVVAQIREVIEQRRK